VSEAQRVVSRAARALLDRPRAPRL
jgi:hypothetical protein